MKRVKSQETRMLERVEIQFTPETEIEEEYCAIKESITSGNTIIAETEPNMLTVHYEDQRSKKSTSESKPRSNDDKYILLSRCRLCAIPNADMVDIFRSNESAADISEMIKYCLPIVVQETDTLPKQACRFCLEILEVCFQFQKTVLKAKQLLLAFDGQAQLKRKQIEGNYHTSLLCSEPCRTMKDDDSEETLTAFSGDESDDNRSAITASQNHVTDATGKSNRVVASPKPCSVILVPTKTNCKNNFDRRKRSSSIVDKHQKADLSMDILNDERSSASHNDRQRLCESGVPERTRSSSRAKTQEILRTYCEEEFENSGSVAVHQEAHPIETHSKRKSGVNTLTSTGEGNRREHDPKSSYKCWLCKKKFDAFPELRRHKAAHSKNGDYRCSQCDKLFQFESTMKRHIAIHTSVNQWLCDHCKKGFATKDNLKVHLNRCHKRPEFGKPLYTCNFCAKSFQNESILRRHSKLHTTERRHSCEYCEKKFISRSKKEEHHRVHTKERPYKCPICEKTFRWSTALRLHAAVHLEKPKYPCSLCDKSFTSSQAREYHARVHIDEIPWKCDHCKKGFRTKSKLKKHLSCYHKRPEFGKRLYTCDYCAKSFENVSSLQYHRKLHTSEGHHICEYCGKRFMCKSKRDEHLRVHTKERPYKCTICDKTFPYSGGLRVHAAVHSNQGKYPCSLCNKSFRSSRSRNEHALVHSHETPWKCDYCKKDFRSNSNLRGHLSCCDKRPEFGKRLYTCNLCAKPFKNESSLQRHSKFHTNEGLHSCGYCRKKFISRSKRDEHQRVHSRGIKMRRWRGDSSLPQ